MVYAVSTRWTAQAYVARPHPRMMGASPGLRGLRKDGSEFPAEIALTPMETEQGMLVYVVIRT